MSDLISLPAGNQSQAIVLSETTDGHLTVVDAASGQNITSSANVTYQNLQIQVSLTRYLHFLLFSLETF